MKKIVWGDDPEFSGPQNYYRETLVITSLKQYVKNGLVLDAGCGNGGISIRFAKDGYKVSAIDREKRCVNFLKHKAEVLKLKNVLKVCQGTLTNLPYKNNVFDAIVCSEVLEHLADDKRAIDEFYRAIKKGGYCVITVPGKPWLWHAIDDISSHKRRYLKEELIEKFRQSGFKIVHCFYWGFPLNSFWHRLIFRPYIVNKLQKGYHITSSHNFFLRFLKKQIVQKYASFVFNFDKLFDWTNFGEFILLVATK